jgi:hypothetical protein
MKVQREFYHHCNPVTIAGVASQAGLEESCRSRRNASNPLLSRSVYQFNFAGKYFAIKSS